MDHIFKTKIFDIYKNKYRNITELARAMQLSTSQVYRVRKGQRNINQVFIVGAVRAFPEYSLDELFYYE